MKKQKEMNGKQTCAALIMVLASILCLSDVDTEEVTFRFIAGIVLIIAATIYTVFFTEIK